ncbi:hypothetical protein GYMLUDRAFT_580154 [Collybiopsis luxurians FD-317 M1]|uniref:Uncharacterized protein n=1 Tax=Collybiopsis luxurians FD-317 M1 TaxID=944289 RepID=A0A0D0BZI7_9AGAR|nr:hypothetical protein GYMLUDRAFT_580154 [Collybiopsis luxurians FD-317 M1]
MKMKMRTKTNAVTIARMVGEGGVGLGLLLVRVWLLDGKVRALCQQNLKIHSHVLLRSHLGPVQNNRVPGRRLHVSNANLSPTEGDLPTMNSTCSYTDTPKVSQIFHQKYLLHEEFLSSSSPSPPARRASQLNPFRLILARSVVRKQARI